MDVDELVARATADADKAWRAWHGTAKNPRARTGKDWDTHKRRWYRAKTRRDVARALADADLAGCLDKRLRRDLTRMVRDAEDG